MNIVDSSGNPASNAALEVRFKQHAYHFGSVTVGHILVSDSTDAQIYRAKVLEVFYQIGSENDLKWGVGWRVRQRLCPGTNSFRFEVPAR